MREAEDKIRELNDRLINDERFRQEFSENPRATVERYGYPIPQELLPDRIELPSPELLRDKLRRAGDIGIGAW